MKDEFDMTDAMDYSQRRSDNEKPTGFGVFKGLPEGVKFYKLKEGKNKIDILPYRIKSKKNPILFDSQSHRKVGDPVYIMRYSTHKNVGADNAKVVCPKSTYNKPCPFCDERIRLYGLGDRDQAKLYHTSDRVVYWVRDLDEDKKEFKLLDQSAFKFEDPLLAESRAAGDDTPIVFAHPTRGKTVRFLGKEESFGKNKFIEATAFGFMERKEQYTKEDVDGLDDVSEYLYVMSYDELETLMHGGTVGTGDEEKADTKAEYADEVYEEPVRRKKEESADEEEPVRRKKAEPEDEDKPKCPFNHRFGHSFEKEEECDNDCPDSVWKSCAKKSKELEA